MPFSFLFLAALNTLTLLSTFVVILAVAIHPAVLRGVPALSLVVFYGLHVLAAYTFVLSSWDVLAPEIFLIFSFFSALVCFYRLLQE